MFATSHTTIALACCLALASIGSVQAQTQNQPPAAEGTAVLDTVTVIGTSAKKDNPFTQSNSNTYLNQEQLDRYTPISAADMLKGQAGVAVGDARNGGGLDVNIRGVQGQSRVGVTIDGGEQMVNVYRGYSGTQQRSYVDPDLIGSVEIEKGSGAADSQGGYIGGTVRMHTIEAKDIIPAGQNFGIRVKGNLGNNSIKPNGISSPNEDFTYNWVEPRGNRSSAWDNLARSGSVAVGWRNENWELMGAYAKRIQGNYFAGKKGYDRYKEAFDDRFAEEGNPAFTSTHGMFYENEEVLNTSSESDSVLLKAKYFIDDEQSIKLGYRNYTAQIGNVMPSALQRYCGKYGNCNPGKNTPGMAQWETGSVHLNAYNIDYRYTPENNDWVDLKVGFWSTHTKTNEISGANPYHPWETKEPHTIGYARMPQTALNWGVNVRNESNLSGSYGDLRWVNGVEYKHEYVKPQDHIKLSVMEQLGERVIRNAKRWESSLFSQAYYEPSNNLELRAGLRYTRYGSEDLNRQPEKSLFCANTSMCMTTGEDMEFIFQHQFEEYAKTAKFLDPIKNKGGKLAPNIGITYYFQPETFVYANYSQAYRMPSLFETSMGTANVKTVASLKPEQANNFELGFSTTQRDLFKNEDALSFKVSYFNNNYKNYITRFLDPNEYFTSSQFMYFTNLDKFKVSGFELNTAYDNGFVFADLSANYFQKAKACDRNIAQKLKEAGIANTPNCVDGGFGSSYAAAQNPPKYSYSLGLGVRLLDQKLTLGSRVTYNHSPIARMDQPWHKIVTTYQKYYEKSKVIDAYAKYEVTKNASINLNVTNLTNEYYLDALTQSYMPAPGRAVNIGFEAKF
ncbi:MAG: TonB-dependent receptor [Neisseriaceae bacterium]|nr:TonB-dependent receptor [Neisseriaceae bacterium]MBP6862713.1 TonB-dependent receptor [Neisseriaceae bacterium]